MTGFMDLSREIRDMIYELCLVVDEVIIPYNELYPLDAANLEFRKNMPAVALLGVSKTSRSFRNPLYPSQIVPGVTTQRLPGSGNTDPEFYYS